MHIDLRSVAAHVLVTLARAQARGRAVRLDEIAESIEVRREDVRDVVSQLHAEGHVDAYRMRITMSGLAIAAALRGETLRAPRARRISRVAA